MNRQQSAMPAARSPWLARWATHLLAVGVMVAVLGLVAPRFVRPTTTAAPTRPDELAGAPAFAGVAEAAPAPLTVASAAPSPTSGPGVEAAEAPLQAHRVAPGETLADIAAGHGVQVETLLWANPLDDPSLLRPDDELHVPAADGLMYIVQPGDSLRAIADRAGAPLAGIVAVNRLPDPDNLVAGTEILVPGASPAQLAAALDEGGQRAATARAAQPLTPATVTYEVQPGDTLGSLGTKFGIDLQTLLDANDIEDPNTIRPGTVLRILPVSGVEHVVKPGETLADIAAQYQVPSGLLYDFNAISDPDLIRVGDRLVIPGGKHVAIPAPAAPALAAPAPVPPAQAPAPKPPAGVLPSSVAAPAPTAVPKPAAPAPRNGPLGQRIAAVAQQYVGARYVWGGTSPTGFDCSGLVWYALKEAGVSVSRGLWGQYNAGTHVSRDELQPGDIVFFQNTYMPGLSHDGIYIGNGLMVNAVDEANGVKIVSLDNPYWASRWFGATRVN